MGQKWSHLFVYLPTRSDTASINSELNLLRKILPGRDPLPRVLLWCQDRMVEDHNGELLFRDDPLKSAYLRDFMARIATTMVNWDIHEELYRRIDEWAKAMAEDR